MLVENDFYFPSRLLKGNGRNIKYGNLRFSLIQVVEADLGRARKRAQVFCAVPAIDRKHLFDDCLLGKVLEAENLM